eukprot:TRINITY_DN6220_c1_g2_i2.p1 TRINITY_DN6220_c1_g2~~TRINITY_DN6220_c1_g2_i2.p1  ORF type:complete len:549 (-),score=16.97 TRINITY_DN6220_c1_g2_i2:44-1690(-)
MACFRLWLHPLHSRRSQSPFSMFQMRRASSHEERLAVLRDVCCEVSTQPLDMAQLTEVVVHPDDLVARSEEVGKPMRLPLRLSQIYEHSILETQEERSGGAGGFIAYAYPMTAYQAQWQECAASRTTEADVWVFVVTANTICSTPSRKSLVLRQAVHALMARGAIAGEVSGLEPAHTGMESGGFGIVRFFQRKHDENSRIYAGKVLEGVDAMSACAECHCLLAARSHPNIVAFVGAFCFLTPLERTWMIVTEAHLGGDVESRVRSCGAFCDREALKVLRDVLKAVAHLHEHLLMHRDVKPANIVVASDGRAVLIDMGLAVHASEKEKRKVQCGTVGFVAPEILFDRGCQLKSDVFGCGALLYFVASGMAPFAGSCRNDTIKLNGRADVSFDHPCFLAVALHTIEFIRNMLQRYPRHRPTARSACDAITFVIEMTTPAEVLGETSHALCRHQSKTAKAPDQPSRRMRQSLKKRISLLSPLKTINVASNSSFTSMTKFSVCSSLSSLKEAPDATEKTQHFFVKVRKRIRDVLVKRTQTEVRPFVASKEDV